MSNYSNKNNGRFYISDDDGDDRILEIKVTDNKVRFRELCDGHFERNTTIPEAKQILLDALAFVESFEVRK